jgi:hypothetical protein
MKNEEGNQMKVHGKESVRNLSFSCELCVKSGKKSGTEFGVGESLQSNRTIRRVLSGTNRQ